MAETSKTESKETKDLNFMFLMLNAHKQGAWKWQTMADTLGLNSAKAAESKYYKLKKTYWDTAGGPELLTKFESLDNSSASAKKKTPAKATPKSKKRQADTDADDVEATPTAKKAKGSADASEEGGDNEKAAKEEPGSDNDWA